MQGLRKVCETVSLSAALILAGPAWADETTLVYPVDLEHSACPEEAFVAATSGLSQVRRKFSIAGLPNVAERTSSIPTLESNDDRPVRRGFRGSRFRHDEAARPRASDAGGPLKARPIETPLREIDENSFPLLPYFQGADIPLLPRFEGPALPNFQEAEREEGGIELAGFLESEPNPIRCPLEASDCDDCPATLPGEAAREILAIRKLMGATLNGTAFDQFDADDAELEADPNAIATRAGALKYLVETIRLLEQQESEQPLPFEYEIELPADQTCVRELAVSTPAAREALRQAGEQLDAAANTLERQELFAQADDLRRKASELRQQARGLASVAPTCGGRALRPTVRTPRQGPQACPGIEACPANAGPDQEGRPAAPRCAAGQDHQSIIWVPREHDPGAVRSFDLETIAPGTRPNPLPSAADFPAGAKAELVIPWWNMGYPVTGPCGATPGVRVGIAATSTGRDMIRVAPGEASVRPVIERLPPIVEELARPARPAPARLPAVEPALRVPVRSSLNAITESVRLEGRMSQESHQIECERLCREVQELNTLAAELARQSQGVRPVSSRYDPETLRREVLRLKRQLEASTMR